MTSTTFPVATVLSLGLLTVCGCAGSDIERCIVTGKVTYNGEPIQNGMIRFFPIEDTKGPMWGALIQNGTYSCHGKGGVPVGALAVEIEGYRAQNMRSTAIEDPVGDLGGTVGNRQFVPSKYNTHTTLRVEIKSGTGRTELDFDLDQ